MMRQGIAWRRHIRRIELERFRAGDERVFGGSLRNRSRNGEGHKNRSEKILIHDCLEGQMVFVLSICCAWARHYANTRIWAGVWGPCLVRAVLLRLQMVVSLKLTRFVHPSRISLSAIT